jgi:hypothetical protein
MDLVIKIILIAFLNWFGILISLGYSSYAECMQRSEINENKGFNGIFRVNVAAVDDEPYNVSESCVIFSDAPDRYHDEVVLPNVKLDKYYRDDSKIDDFKNVKIDDIDKGSVSLAGFVGCASKVKLSASMSATVGSVAGSFYNSVAREHLEDDLSKDILNNQMRKMFFNETKNAMSKEEYDSLLMQYSIEKLPKDRFLERDECLRNRFE